jgi:SAM-dependent methyltransferase
LALARACAGKITAVDFHEPFIDELRRRAEAAGFAERIVARVADMRTLRFPDASFDLIWSEGAIYIMGFAAGLSMWRRLLKPHGCMVVSELTWTSREPEPEESAFWSSAYPAMQSDAANRSAIETAGYELIGSFRIPRKAWFDQYYTPLEDRAKELRGKYAGDADANGWIGEQLREVDIVRRYSGFDYVFYAMRRRG